MFYDTKMDQQPTVVLGDVDLCIINRQIRSFLIAQGYTLGPMFVHQDNLSCMALIKKGGPWYRVCDYWSVSML